MDVKCVSVDVEGSGEAGEAEEGVLCDDLFDGVKGALVGLGSLPFGVLSGHRGKWMKDACTLLFIILVIVDQPDKLTSFLFCLVGQW